MDFLDDFDFGVNGDIDMSLAFGEEEDNLLSEICKELVDSDAELEIDLDDNSSNGLLPERSGGMVDACKYGIGKRLQDIPRPDENHDNIDHDDDQEKPHEQNVHEKPAKSLKSLNEEELERKLEASKKKLHARYQEAVPKRKVQVLELKECPDLKRAKKCIGDKTKRCWVQSSTSTWSSSIPKKKLTSSCFPGGRMGSCK